MQPQKPIVAFIFFAILFLFGVQAGGRTAAQAKTPQAPPREVVVYATDLPTSALSEFSFWAGPASPGGKMVGTPNSGDNLDPPPEDDPHVLIKIQVQPGVPYRPWIHMYVGQPKGVSKANLVWVQFTNALDKTNKAILAPGTADYLTLQGPTREGWVWVGSERLVYFQAAVEVTARIQAGMEGVGFDQLVLSPARFLDKAPSEAVVAKSK